MEVGKPCSANVWATAESRRLCRKVGTDTTRHQNRGALIDDSEGFDHMVLFAVRIRRNARSIFEVKLPMSHWRGAFQGFAHRGKARGKASVFPQESVNGAG